MNKNTNCHQMIRNIKHYHYIFYQKQKNMARIRLDILYIIVFNTVIYKYLIYLFVNYIYSYNIIFDIFIILVICMYLFANLIMALFMRSFVIVECMFRYLIVTY